MGRVTFQTPAVKTLLEQNFVKTHCNSLPGFSGTPLMKGTTDLAPLLAEWWPSGTADSNVLTLLTTSDGVVLHLLRGYIRPRDFEREVRWALDLARKVKANDALVTRREVIRRAHENRLASLCERFGTPEKAVDTTRPPAPDAFEPDRFPHALIAMHADVLNDPGDVRLLPTVRGTWDRGRGSQANVPRPRPGKRESDGVGAGEIPAAADAPRVTTRAEELGGVSNGTAPGGLVQGGNIEDALAANRLAQAAADRQRAQDARRRAAATAAAQKARGLVTGVPTSAITGLAAVALTSRDLHCARQASAAAKLADTALSFYRGDRCHVGCEQRVLQQAQQAGPAALYRLFEETRGEQAEAAYKALAAITGRSCGPDEAAWRAVLEAQARSRR